ncbi:hypothetical protein [Chitinophaga sp. Cy-1792]|uniref:hypothetical protein n=1 Tax=Chitinophaga sp. Cy-1792 TaxID=2608339 RepID=UPI001424278D|nr:hypothetical protein [Chitinophaga sp. Cy-1792]NIG54989.1 hypothetical protein [Chitinophaga sp. Cy-1792]
MTQVATFSIRESFYIKDLGLILAGEITAGRFSIQNTVRFQYNGATYSLKIKGWLHLNRGRAPGDIGLYFYYTPDLGRKTFNQMKIEAQIVNIEEESQEQ